MARGPLHPQLAHLERAYMTVRNRAADGEMTNAEAAELLKDSAVVDHEGSLWWVDFESSIQSAQFFSNKGGEEKASDPADFRHRSPVAVPANNGNSHQNSASALLLDTSSIPRTDTTPKTKTASESAEEGDNRSGLERAADTLAARLAEKREVEEAYESIPSETPERPYYRPSVRGIPRIFYVVPGIVIVFILSVVLLSRGGETEIAPPADSPTTVVAVVEQPSVTIAPEEVTETTLPGFDPETALFEMPIG